MKFECPIINTFVFEKNVEEERLRRRCSPGSANSGQQIEEDHFYFSGALSSTLCGLFLIKHWWVGFLFYFREIPVLWSQTFCGSALTDGFPAEQRSLPRAAARDRWPGTKPVPCQPSGWQAPAVSQPEPAQMPGCQDSAWGLTGNTDIISGWGPFLFLPREHQHF